MSTPHDNSESPGVTPVEAQMETTLRSFFRTEVPAQLSRPAFLDVIDARPNDAVPRLAPSPEIPASPRRSTTTRWFVSVASLVLIIGFMVITPGLWNHPQTDSEPRTTQQPPTHTADPGIDNKQSMLVSPAAGQSDAQTTPLGNSGVTLEEVEGVELQP